MGRLGALLGVMAQSYTRKKKTKQEKNGIMSLGGRRKSQDKGRGLLKYRIYSKEMFAVVNSQGKCWRKGPSIELLFG